MRRERGFLDSSRGFAVGEVQSGFPDGDDRMMVETDCPYLAPVPYRGKTNEPAYLPETLGVLASCRKEDPAELANTLLENTRRLFALDRGTPG